ncbi:hypothetical protein EDB92DRAFT_1859668 [Lactarius akahatsu]|uniref:Uncharacterized protein n=1 Tax=Lactarius akahatsu TaxID=416441 RepID=A0AAD4LID1_9AGAM|nr:hypothetical protein EDB92DRAFT_1859668 [Lactarius akahatsu]
MKFSAALTTFVFILPLLSGQAFVAGQRNNGKNQGNKGAAPPPPAKNTGAGNNTGAANNQGAGAGGDPQTSLTLDPKVISAGFEKTGQEVPTAGQVASLTSSNNFINFCLTVNKPLTNGLQTKTGSCNTAPLGVIAATTNMPSSKFTNPVNGQDIAANTPFDITMAVKNLVTGNFVNAASNYYAAPQQVNAQGNIMGHSHFTVQAIPSFTSTQPLDPNVFQFFKGVNGAAVNGVLKETVTAGLPAGFYRCCSINTDANHTPVLVAVAQHGSLDDCVYFSVGKGNGANPFNGGAANTANNTAAPPAAGNTTAAGKGAATNQPPANQQKGNQQKGNQQKGKGGRRMVARLSRDY